MSHTSSLSLRAGRRRGFFLFLGVLAVLWLSSVSRREASSTFLCGARREAHSRVRTHCRAGSTVPDVMSGNKLLHAQMSIRDVNKSIAFYKACGMRVLAYNEYPNGQATAFVGFGEYRDTEHFALELTAPSPKSERAKRPVDVGNGFQYMCFANMNVSAALASHGELSPWSTYYEQLVDDPTGYTVKPEKGDGPGDPFRTFCLSVSDLAVSKHFYCDYLGMMDQAPEGLDDTRLNCAMRYANKCREGKTVSLGLVEGQVQRGDGFDHLAISTMDVHAAAAALQSKGVDVFLPPTVMFGINITGVRDPDGYSVYLVEESGYLKR
eukprot:TRINITY_DN58611_c0_g1_i1.p1 TRINITY_DN58611_c0_g1~~TRINITY_DN58611_c0_g1_i1.p1  ORF type:complete len:323 (+),score=19.50 TRINITY_DN58611_c0_g1_i1:73-1041(+)